MRGWDKKTIDWYMRAGEHSQYPRLVLAEILPRLEPNFTVLDIGCGPGVYALALAPRVALILALDRSPLVLEHLSWLSQTRSLNNIRCLNASWPCPIPEQVDVVLSALGSGEIMTGEESLGAIFALKPRLVFLVAPGQYRNPFAWQEHRPRPAPDGNDTLALLARLGIPYTAKALALDFGQPVHDLAEAAEFLARFLEIPQSLAREQAEAIARPHGPGLYLPNPRNILLITLENPALPAKTD